MTIGSRIRDLRGRENLEDFSLKFNVTSSQISRIENGKSGISNELAISICDHFNCSLDWLMRGIENTYNVAVEPPDADLQRKYMMVLEENLQLYKKLNKEYETEIKKHLEESRV